MCCRVFIHSALLTFWSSLNGNLSSFPFFTLVVSFSCGRPTFSYLVFFFFYQREQWEMEETIVESEKRIWEREKFPAFWTWCSLLYGISDFPLVTTHATKKKEMCYTWDVDDAYRSLLSAEPVAIGYRRRRPRPFVPPSPMTRHVEAFQLSEVFKIYYVVIPLTNVSLSFPC